jgi:hypothetical protein
MLRHKTLQMTDRYVNRDIDPLRTLSDVVQTRIANALGGERLGDEREREVDGDPVLAGYRIAR